jgi:hypothetical protein
VELRASLRRRADSATEQQVSSEGGGYPVRIVAPRDHQAIAPMGDALHQHAEDKKPVPRKLSAPHGQRRSSVDF